MEGWFKFTPVSSVKMSALGRKRKPVSRLSVKIDRNASKKAKLLPLDEIVHCCRNHCFKLFPDLSPLQHLRDTFWSFTKNTARKLWFKETVLPAIPDNLDPDEKQFTLLAYPVCYSFVRAIFGCSNNLLVAVKGTRYAVEKLNTQPFRPPRTGVAFKNYDFTKREEVVLWLNYQRQFYEIQPDRDEVLLPWSFKGEVYRQYKLNPTVGSCTVELVHRDPCTLQYFLLVWKQDVPGLKCRRFHRFMICDTCSNLNAKLLCRTIEGEARVLYQQAKDEHIQQVKEDRYFYGMRIMEARQFRDDIWSMVIDGSDASEWCLPHPAIRTHESQKGKKIAVKCYGVIVHGHFCACYVFNSYLPGGTNVTIECLHRTFLKLRAQGKLFPRRLNLQLDNTSKDNKARYLMAYLFMLVCCGLFEEIQIFFFQVGHTHCDADQIFSRSSIYLRDKDIWNFDLLCLHILNSCGIIQFCEKVEHFVPWKQNIESLLVPKHQSTGIQQFRLFRIVKEEGVVRYQCKRNVHDRGQWHDYSMTPNAIQKITIDNTPITAVVFDNFTAPYVIPGLPKTNVNGEVKELEYRELHNAISGSAHRIHMSYANIEVSAPIIQSMVEEVDKMRHTRTIPFDWDISMYKNPACRGAPTILAMSDTEREDYNKILHRKAVDKLYKITNGLPLELDELEELSMLIVRADPEDPKHYPFWVAEVGNICKVQGNPNYNKVQVCWFAPSTRSKNDLTSVQYSAASFVPEVSTKADKRDKHSLHKTVKRIADWIDLDTIVVVFSHLNSGGKIPKKVLDKLLEDEHLRNAVGLAAP